VTPQDVRLVARRQPNIVSKLDEIVSILEEEKRKKRKKNDATFNVCLTKKEMKNFDNSFNFNWNTQRK
jgi:singapore isolate B (sub-type 7) whole genome shotgun sequence assembly, scaffold_10